MLSEKTEGQDWEDMGLMCILFTVQEWYTAFLRKISVPTRWKTTIISKIWNNASHCACLKHFWLWQPRGNVIYVHVDITISHFKFQVKIFDSSNGKTCEASACKSLFSPNSFIGFIVQHSSYWNLRQHKNRNSIKNYLPNPSLYNCISPLWPHSLKYPCLYSLATGDVTIEIVQRSEEDFVSFWF